MTNSPNEDDLSAKETLLSSPFPSLKAPHRPSITQTTLLLILLPTSLLTLTLGIFIGVHLPHQPLAASLSTLPPPPGTVHQIWQHNLTFSQAPTPESEEAWSSIIPVGRGFIHHEELAPFISNIAVFHQLHCLHAILVAYYLALSPPTTTSSPSSNPNNNSSQPPIIDPTTHTRTALPHVQHCFDYLRRSLMCAADTNLEVVGRKTHTTNGWGQEKVCRDYEGVREFAEKWKNSSDVGILSVEMMGGGVGEG